MLRHFKVNPALKINETELKNFEWDILNPDHLINLEIKKKSGLSSNPDIHHSKVSSSDQIVQV